MKLTELMVQILNSTNVNSIYSYEALERNFQKLGSVDMLYLGCFLACRLKMDLDNICDLIVLGLKDYYAEEKKNEIF
jgi:hypothetical protein